MLRRIPLAILLAIQVLGGGAVTLAHARDVIATPPAVEAGHDARCAILHDELRCALCHYASARVVAPPTVALAAPAKSLRFFPVAPPFSIAAVASSSAPARAPPPQA